MSQLSANAKKFTMRATAKSWEPPAAVAAAPTAAIPIQAVKSEVVPSSPKLRFSGAEFVPGKGMIFSPSSSEKTNGKKTSVIPPTTEALPKATIKTEKPQEHATTITAPTRVATRKSEPGTADKAAAEKAATETAAAVKSADKPKAEKTKTTKATETVTETAKSEGNGKRAEAEKAVETPAKAVTETDTNEEGPPLLGPQTKWNGRRPAKETAKEKEEKAAAEKEKEEAKKVAEKAKGGQEEKDKREGRRSRAASEKEAEEQLENSMKARVYNREFLMKFQPMFTDKPPNLPDMEAIIGSDSNRKAGANRGPAAAGWTVKRQDSRGGRGGRADGNRKGRDGQKGGRGGRGPKTKDQPMDIVVVPLERSETAYVIQRDIEKDQMTIRNLRAILNKLTPEKFDVLVAKVKEIEIDTEDLLKESVDAVFEKALAEPAFSPVYAEFCKTINPLLPVFKSEVDETANSFKRLILNRCQAEFERENNQDPVELGKMGEEERADHDAMLKRRMLGTIRLIGELYKRKMLSSSIMTSCVFILYGDAANPNEENIEALCKLLSTVGKMLESDKNREKNSDYMTQLFSQLRQLTKHEKLSSRIRFMVQDVLELRQRNWVQRVEENVAKKISEIRKEDSEEKRKKEKEDARNNKTPRNRERDSIPQQFDRKLNVGRDRYSTTPTSRSSRTPTKKQEVDGWSTQPSGRKAGKWQKDKSAPSTPSGDGRKEKSRSANNTPRSKPGRSPAPSPASGKGKAEKPPRPTASNAFSMLNDDDDEDEGDSDTGIHEVDHPSHDSDTASGAGSDAGSEGGARDQAGGEDTIDAEEARKKIRSLLNEYFSSMDLQEVKLCIQELGSTQFYPKIVCTIMELAIDGKQSVRDAVPALFAFLATERVLTSDHFLLGLSEFLMFLDDVVIDAPLAPKHVGIIMAPLILSGHVDIGYLSGDELNHLQPDGNLSKICAESFKEIIKLRDEETLKGLVGDADFQFVRCIKKGADVAEWMNNQGLSMLEEEFA